MSVAVLNEIKYSVYCPFFKHDFPMICSFAHIKIVVFYHSTKFWYWEMISRQLNEVYNIQCDLQPRSTTSTFVDVVIHSCLTKRLLQFFTSHFIDARVALRWSVDLKNNSIDDHDLGHNTLIRIRERNGFVISFYRKKIIIQCRDFFSRSKFFSFLKTFMAKSSTLFQWKDKIHGRCLHVYMWDQHPFSVFWDTIQSHVDLSTITIHKHIALQHSLSSNRSTHPPPYIL